MTKKHLVGRGVFGSVHIVLAFGAFELGSLPNVTCHIQQNLGVAVAVHFASNPGIVSPKKLFLPLPMGSNKYQYVSLSLCDCPPLADDTRFHQGDAKTVGLLRSGNEALQAPPVCG